MARSMMRSGGTQRGPADRRETLLIGATLLGLLVLAAWIRLDGLGRWGFWRDEAQCLFIAQKPFPAGIVDALLAEAHPPLYYSLQHFWIELAGWSEFRIRLLSAAFGVLLVPGLFVAGSRLFGAATGLGAALFGAVAPLHVAVSQTARMYSLLALLSLLSVWLLYESWKRGGWWWVGYVLSTVGALYTHNWGLFLLVAQNCYALWMMVTRKESGRRLLPWIAVQVGVGVLYLPWLLNLLQQMRIIQALPFVPAASPLETLWRICTDLLAYWPALLTWLALLAIGLWPRRASVGSRETDEGLPLIIWSSFGTLGLGLIVSLQTYGGVPSYVTLSAFPALCLLLGRGLAGLRRARFAIPVAILVVLLSAQGIGIHQHMFRSTLREVAREVEQKAGPNDLIVIAPDFIATTFNTYYQGTQAQIAFPWTMSRLEEINCVGWNDRWLGAAEAVPATLEAIDRQLGPDGRLWVVANPAEYPDDELYYGQIRRLLEDLNATYYLEQSDQSFRNGAEWADIYVYRRP